jgi:hypothetical protein
MCACCLQEENYLIGVRDGRPLVVLHADACGSDVLRAGLHSIRLRAELGAAAASASAAASQPTTRRARRQAEKLAAVAPEHVADTLLVSSHGAPCSLLPVRVLTAGSVRSLDAGELCAVPHPADRGGVAARLGVLGGRRRTGDVAARCCTGHHRCRVDRRWNIS